MFLLMRFLSGLYEGEINMFDFMILEERVYGGGMMMFLFGGSLK